MKKSTRITAFLLVALMLLTAFPLVTQAQSTQPIRIFVDGQQVTIRGTQPVIQAGRTLVGARDVFEHLGFTVTWNGDRREARMARADFTLYLWIGSPNFEVINHVTGVDSAGTLDVPAQIIDGSTMIPLRFPLEAVGYTMSWDGANRIANIYTNRDADTPIPTPTPAPQTRGERTTNSNAIRPRSELTDLEFAVAVWEYVNLWREELGLRPYLWDDRLAEASQRHSDSMAQHGYFSHSSTHTGSPSQRARAAGWPSGVDEGITTTRTTAAAAVRAFYNSPSHRAFITVRDFDGSEGAFGVGVSNAGVTVKAGDIRHANIGTLVDSRGLNADILAELGLN